MRVFFITVAVILIFVFSLITFTSQVLYAEANFPYKEGDWFVYRVTMRLGEKSCWGEFKVTVLRIDTVNDEVKIEVEGLRFGDEEYCESAIRNSYRGFFDGIMTLDLNVDPRTQLQILVNPRYTGEYDCGGLGWDCKMTYDKGVLKDIKVKYEYFGAVYEYRISLIDSSVFEYSSLYTWLVIAIIVGIVATLFIVALYMVKKRSKPKVIQPGPTEVPGPAPTPAPTVALI